MITQRSAILTSPLAPRDTSGKIIQLYVLFLLNGDSIGSYLNSGFYLISRSFVTYQEQLLILGLCRD